MNLLGGSLSSRPAAKSTCELAYNGKKSAAIINILRNNIVGANGCAKLGRFGIESSQHELTASWFVGFWDAEGSSGYYSNSFQLNVAQKGDVVLSEIVKRYGGVINDNSGTDVWVLHGTACKPLWELLLSYSRHPKVGDLRFNLVKASLLEPLSIEEANQARRIVEGQSEQHKLYYQENADVLRVKQRDRSKAKYDKEAATRKYLESHPEVVAEFSKRLETND